METQPSVRSVRTQYTGAPGTGTRYYWVQAIYPSGRSVLSVAAVADKLNSLSVLSTVGVTWTPMPGATAYDVVVTTSSTEPTAESTTTIGLAFGVSGPEFLDQGQALRSWTYESGNGGSFDTVTVDETLVASGADNNVLFQAAGTVSESTSLTFDGTVLTATAVTTAILLTPGVAVASLPGTPTAGQRAFVTDSNAVSFTAGIGAVVAAGGTTKVPVVYDGTNWRIG